MTDLHRESPTDGRASSKHLDGCNANGTERKAAVPGPGVDELLAHLAGVAVLGRGHWKALCPCHGDRRASLAIDVKVSRWKRAAGVYVHCKGCGAGGDDVLAVLGLTAQRQRIYYEGNGVYLADRPKRQPEKLSLSYVEKAFAYLWENPALLDYVTVTRGISHIVARRQRLGYDEGRERWTIPIYDGRGRLVDVRRYDPEASKDEGKMRSARGTKAALYVPTPRPRRLSETVVVCEGEWDALAAASGGLRAATGTLGAGTWLPGWSRWLAGLDVVVVYDCDDAGRDGAAKAAVDVAAHARSVRVLDLDPGREDAWDLSDWFAEGRTARDLIALAASVSPLGEEGGGPRE